MKLDWTGPQLRVSITKPYSSYVRTVLLERFPPEKTVTNTLETFSRREVGRSFADDQ
jgi:hypothetical protein